MPEEVPALPRWAVAVLGALCAAAGLYTLYRGAAVTLEYFDGYQFLVTTKRLAGNRSTGPFNFYRPPLLALLDLPALWIAQRGALANAAYTRGPHLVAALLGLFSGWTLYYTFTAALERRLALLGVALFVTGRLFLRYGSLTMADLLSMAFAALAVGLHLRALDRPSFARDALVGVALGLGAAAKYPILLMGAVVLLTELLMAWKRRRLPARRLGGLAVSGAATVVTFLAVMAVVYGLAVGWNQLGHLLPAVREGFRLGTEISQAYPGETRWDNAVMISAVIAWPILALAVFGIVLALKERQERDLPFLAWLFGMGGIFVTAIGHNEVRYLLPEIPALIYFAVRAAQWSLRRAPSSVVAGAGVVALALACAWGGIRQAWADADPAFRADTPRRAAAAMARLHRPGGQYHWMGPFSCIYPVSRVPLPRDEFFDSFNLYGPALVYFLDQPATPLPSLTEARDGDAVVVPGPGCNGLVLPATPPAPWIVHGASRRRLIAVAGGYATAEKDLELSVVSQPGGLSLRVVKGAVSAGVQRTLIVSDPSPRSIGPLPLAAGSLVSLGTRGGQELRGIELLELTQVAIPAR